MTVSSTRVLATLLLLFLIRPSFSEAIQITGSGRVDVVTTTANMFLNVTGPSGFSLFAGRQFVPSASLCEFHDITSSDDRCDPGDLISLSGSLLDGLTSASGGGMAIVDDAAYNMSFNPCPSCVGTAEVTGTFTGFDFIAPSFSLGPTFLIEGPFVFNGTFTYQDASGAPVGVEPLTGRGRVTYALIQAGEGYPEPTRWLRIQQSYEFDLLTPTPEPTTLLLWGTGAAGLGVARWVKRRRQHAP